MHRFSTITALILLLAIGGVPLQAEKTADSAPADQTTVKSDVNISDDKAAVTIAGSPATDVNLPRVHFRQARESFLASNRNAAADHIREGAKTMRTEAAGLKNKTGNDLSRSADEMDRLADQVRSGEVSDVATLDKKFADAYQAMSDFYFARAQQTWDARDEAGENKTFRERVGRDLDEAQSNFRNWAEASGQKLGEGTNKVLDASKNIAGKLVSGTGWVAEEVGDALNRFGQTAAQYGRRLQRDAKTPDTPAEQNATETGQNASQ